MTERRTLRILAFTEVAMRVVWCPVLAEREAMVAALPRLGDPESLPTIRKLAADARGKDALVLRSALKRLTR